MPRETIHISAPATYVFDWIDDPRQHLVPPPNCTARLESSDPLPHRVGHRYSIQIKLIPTFWIRYYANIGQTHQVTRTEYERPHQLAIRYSSSWGSGGMITTERWRLVEDASGTRVTVEYQSEFHHRLSRLKHEIESALGLPSDPATYKPEVWVEPRPLPRREVLGDGGAALALGLAWVSAVTMPALLGSPVGEAVPIVALATLAAGAGLVLLVRRRMRARRADAAENALGSADQRVVVLLMLGIPFQWYLVFVAVTQVRMWLRAPADTWSSAWVATTASAVLIGIAWLASQLTEEPDITARPRTPP